MKKVIVGVVLLGVLSACKTTTTTTSPTPATTSMTGAGTGAADPASALRGFLDAAKAQNIQGLSAYWGDKDGTVRGRLGKVEEEQREIIMVKCLRHERFEVIGD